MADSLLTPEEAIRIAQLITELLGTTRNNPVRIVGYIPIPRLDKTYHLESIRQVTAKVQEGTRAFHSKYTACFLAAAIEHAMGHALFIVDINNVDYDFDIAMNGQPKVPVHALSLLMDTPTLDGTPLLDGPVARGLARMHRKYPSWGKDDLPFFDVIGVPERPV
ncbi:hypothetical protein BJX99DRAFT_260762 [Aspergillus californicus]